MKKLYILLFALYALNGAMAQWLPQNSGTSTDLSSIYFTDSNTGYAGGWDNLLLKTLDGGMTWDTANTPTEPGYFNSIFFTDANTGYAAGNGMLKTADAGLTWAYNQTCNKGPLTSVFFIDENIGYTCGSEQVGGIRYWIYKTIDGGTTWFITSEGEGELFYSLFFTDANTGYAAGNSIIKTVDGGTTWDTILNIVQPGWLSSVFFTDANTGYAVGTSIIKTTDGGITWDTLSAGAISSLNAVYFIDANTGYAVGRLGTIIKTLDAGLTWVSQSSGTDNRLLSIYFPTFDTGYIVGSNGTILKTTNGGGDPNGTSEKPQITNLNLYPNPANQLVTISSKNIQTIQEVTLYNQTGQKVYRGIPENNTLDISKLQPGMYVVEVLTKEGNVRKKLIIQ